MYPIFLNTINSNILWGISWGIQHLNMVLNHLNLGT